MAHRLIVAGIGPGSREYILSRALSVIESARFLVGGRRALSDFAKAEQETFPVTGDLSSLVTWISEKLAVDDVVVMVSGDPGFYSLLPFLKKKFSEIPITVIPGISSVQTAFCAVGESWQGGDWLSFHGRVPDEKKLLYETGKRLAFLTDGEHDAAYISKYLVRLGWPVETRAAACEHLSYENERIVTGTLADIAKLSGFAESVLVVMG